MNNSNLSKSTDQQMRIEECRQLLEGIDLTDEEIEELRDALYVIVRQVFNALDH